MNPNYEISTQQSGHNTIITNFIIMHSSFIIHLLLYYYTYRVNVFYYNIMLLRLLRGAVLCVNEC